MFVNDQLVYIQLQKTGCTHIARVMHAVSPGTFHVKHSPMRIDPGERLIVGSVRNPWDWYVSLWAFGCLGEGSISANLTFSFPAIAGRLARQAMLHPKSWGDTARKIGYHWGKDAGAWRSYYENADDPELFRAWLRALLADPGKRLLMEEYPVLPLRAFAGLMTFRFLQLHVAYDRWMAAARTLRSEADVIGLYRDHGVVEQFIRTERLDQDLAAVLDRAGIAYRQDDVFRAEKTNTSKHRSSAYYYDNETVDLVRRNEALIVQTFGYEAPSA